MASIAAISVSITARTTKFLKGMKRARRALVSFGKSAARLTAGMGKFAAAGIAVAVGALSLMVKKAFETGDAVAKMSDRLGIATEKLQGLQFAATITGSNAETLNKSLTFLSKTIGEVKTGVGEGKQAFEALGLSLADIAGKSPDEQILLLADSFAKLTNQEDKAFVATKLFGRSGVAMINMLDLGAQGMRELIAETEALGLNLTRIDAAKLEIANDEIVRMKSVFSGFINQLAVQVAPLLFGITNQIVDFAKKGGGAAEIVGRAWHEVLKVFGQIADWFAVLNAGWQTLRGIAAVSIETIVGLTSVLLQGLSKVSEFFGSDLINNTANYFEALAFGLKDTAGDAFEAAGRSWETFENKINSTRIGEFVSRVTQEVEGLAEAIAATAVTRIAEKAAQLAPEKIKKATDRVGGAGPRDLAGSLATFRQVSLSRVAIPGVSRGKAARNPQITETNLLLANIDRHITQNGLT